LRSDRRDPDNTMIVTQA